MPTVKKFVRTIQIHFRDADPAGIMYFANIFSMAHDTFEHFIQEAGLSWAEWFNERKYFVPIRHCESNFLSPLLPGQTYDIKVHVESISTSSFCMFYSFEKAGQLHAQVKMTHTFVDPKNKKKTTVPDSIKSILQPYLQGHHG